ncbi:hypothetical protein PHYSODRAFT_330370 [Phytophthora sojae]|uniref:Uncharacterized protein n=1 Tax=Phytophthora sojae (strain P6497) TaxID=1094619 RepID=G4Z9H8_PHYSP|nr:hypothetical protein PHYSODRAFT_330370 [Phytophthora sojae]EGZ22610.1 hypothetical protein PHYSODRAFT_330370 [Phytophthora sojae]|eukprot:XP_009525327.1 hypothetical protein PHYSODRAFT_330370 [Phytophthora sojae]
MPQDGNNSSLKGLSNDEEGACCLYPSKRCDNLRVTKANGQLHKFCQYHRGKANYNQRQLEFKRRMQREQLQSAVGRCSKSDNQDDEDFELDEEYLRLIEEVATSTVADGALHKNH